jgi:hypothetical protein
MKIPDPTAKLTPIALYDAGEVFAASAAAEIVAEAVEVIVEEAEEDMVEAVKLTVYSQLTRQRVEG